MKKYYGWQMWLIYIPAILMPFIFNTFSEDKFALVFLVLFPAVILVTFFSSFRMMVVDENGVTFHRLLSSKKYSYSEISCAALSHSSNGLWRETSRLVVELCDTQQQQLTNQFLLITAFERKRIMKALVQNRVATEYAG